MSEKVIGIVSPRAVRVLLLGILVVVALAACGGGDEDGSADRSADAAALSHVHGLGVNPSDGALFIATHNGLFRAPEGVSGATRVGDLQQDTMGFAVIGKDHFLGSGHPDARSDQHPLLGLIESRDAGKSWQPVLLEGEADFHAIEAADDVFYAYDAHGNRLFRGTPGSTGLSLVRRPPGNVIDLAVDPSDSRTLFAATDRGLYVSRDGGERWRPLNREATGLLAHDGDALFLLDGAGSVQAGSSDGTGLAPVGRVDGAPAALTAAGKTLLAAVQEGPVVQSTDGGRTWEIRVAG